MEKNARLFIGSWELRGAFFEQEVDADLFAVAKTSERRKELWLKKLIL